QALEQQQSSNTAFSQAQSCNAAATASIPPGLQHLYTPVPSSFPHMTRRTSYTTAMPAGSPLTAGSTAQMPTPPAETAILSQCTTCHQCGSLVPLVPPEHSLNRSMSTPSFDRIAEDLRPETLFDDYSGMGSNLSESVASSVSVPGSFSSMMSPTMGGLNISFNNNSSTGEASKNAESDSQAGSGVIRRPMSQQSLRGRTASPRVRFPRLR
ncbi:hypothetical protein B0J12DRAFT_72862, partial [Macrophomina phaseolina]